MVEQKLVGFKVSAGSTTSHWRGWGRTLTKGSQVTPLPPDQRKQRAGESLDVPLDGSSSYWQGQASVSWAKGQGRS